MSTLKPIIKGKFTREAEALADLEKLADAASPPPGAPKTKQPPAAANLSNGFYQIDKPRILSATSVAYRQFLRDSGYGDLNSCQGMKFAKGVLKYDQNVRDAGTRSGLNLTGTDGQYVVSINQTNGRKLVEALGYKLTPAGLMYNVFIPYIKELAQQGNAEAQATLNEMTDTTAGKAEWLEDLILDKTRLKIGTQERIIVLPNSDGRFDRADIDEFGYPTQVKAAGEFYHWHVSGDERAAFRSWGSGLVLNLNWVPSFGSDGLGVRRAKIF